MAINDLRPGYRLEQVEGGTDLVVTDAWSTETSLAIESGRVSGLALNYAHGFKDTNLEFLQPWPIKRLTILARSVKDLTPVRRLSASLESLSVQSAASATIDLATFPLLQSVAANWGQVKHSVADAPQLKDLLVRSYNEFDLTPLRWNPSLRRLRFKDRPSVQSLAGVEHLGDLKHLAVYLAPLGDIGPLRSLDSVLEELHLEGCRIYDLSPLACARTLRVINASECGDVETLGPLRGLANLEVLWLFGSTRVVDGDLSPLTELPSLRELRMRSRPAYRPSVGEVQALISRDDQ
ncbi:MAG: hypothetical protein ABI658_19305 [Acidimicrobiales bacterium]